MRKALLFAALAASLFAAGCHTVAGAGRDISDPGHAVTDTAHAATPK